jgi:homoserine kinase type II
MLQHNSAVYELFEYIRGEAYDGSLMSTEDSGRVLGLYHKLLHEYTPEFEPPVGSFHQSKAVPGGLDQITGTFTRKEGAPAPTQGQVKDTVAFLGEAYNQAVAKVNLKGLNDWPTQIVHCDWHPGNMLFRNGKVVAVIDYDAARLQQRVMDIANGVLQFSIIGGSSDPGGWPDYVDERRFLRFLRGYDAVDVVTVAEMEVLPWLMIEAMVAESVLPIAATGSFGRIEGYGFLQMIERKVRWVQKHTQQLIKAASG